MSTSLMPQGRQRYFNNDGTVAAGCKLYTYAAGTTTPKATYTDAAGTIPHQNPITLDGKGEAVIFWDGAYKVDLLTADGVQITGYPVDNCRSSNSYSDSGLAALIASLLSANGSDMIGDTSGNSVGRQLDTLYYGVSNVIDPQFAGGATPGGVVDARAAIQAAVNVRRAAGGGPVKLPPGTFLINPVAGPDGLQNGIVVPYNSAHGTANRVWIEGSGADTVLLAGGNNMTIVRYADSHGGVESLSFGGNGHTGVYGLSVIPEDMTQTTTNVYTIYNVFRDLYMTDLAEGIYLTFGPKVAGFDSGCYYNRFDNIHIYSCLRGIYAPARSALFGGGVGRNLFSNVRIGQSCNTGLQMDAGGTNTFLHCNFEGITSGVTPNATPTAVIVTGTGNNYNHFIGCHIEGCTRDIECNTTYMYWDGGSFDPAKCLFTQRLRMLLGGSIGTGGYLGGGVVDPQYPLNVVTPNGADIRLTNAAAGSTYLQCVGAVASTISYDAANASAQQVWLLNAAEKMRLNAAGYLKASNTGTYNSSSASYHELDGSDNVSTLIVKSTTAASQSGAGGNVISTFSVLQTGANLFRGENGGVATFLVNCNGNVTNTSNSYGAISDEKLKQDIEPAKSQWDDVLALELYKYRLKSDPDGPMLLGLLAGKTKAVSPGLVGETEDFVKVTKQRLEPRTRLAFDEHGEPVLDDAGVQLTEEFFESIDYDEYVPLGTVTMNIKYSIAHLKALGALQENMRRTEALEAANLSLSARVAVLEAEKLAQNARLEAIEQLLAM